MGYVRITIHLLSGKPRTGIRQISDSEDLESVRAHALRLSADVLGRAAIMDVTVEALAADDPGVVALILGGHGGKALTERSEGEHPFVREQRRRPLH